MDSRPVHLDELLGAIFLEGKWRFFAGILGEWILDYNKFDSSFKDRANRKTFRAGIVQLNRINALLYFQALQEREFSMEEVQEMVTKYREDEDPIRLDVVIDFDRQVLVNGYFDYPIEDYAYADWNSYFGDVYGYIPNEISRIWTTES